MLTKDDIQIPVISYTEIDREIKIKKSISKLAAPKWTKHMGNHVLQKQDYFSMVSRKVKEVIMKKIIFNTIKHLILILTAMFLLWVLVSWIDIVAHNDPWKGSHKYIPGNVFVLLTQDYI